MDEETREQFRRIDGQFEKVGEHFERVDGQFEKVAEQFLRLFHFLDGRFTAIDERFNSVETDISDLRDEMHTNFDALYKRDGDRQIEYQVIKAALSRVEATVRDVQSSVNRLEAADLENRVARLEEAVHRDHDA